MQGPQAIIQFWFVDHGKQDWFGGKPEFDAELAEAFGNLHPQIAAGEAWSWRVTPEGRLAEIVALDQFSRQLHRGRAEAFAQDRMALALAQEAISQGADDAVDRAWAAFFYLPFMHSESLVIQEEGVRLYTQHGDPDNLDFMLKHRDTIARFGRFPFRNAALGRQSTAEELAYMREQGDRSF
ncbi:DUF924 domain-containing protein [Devosia sp. PTR5]|uniref:DUF924 domain-containing protein n=1 Tax=Devosia oryzisoli TaxID=2774138 RepID=A0A927ITG1_9HYPH|nr:DUF924 family protein [Devosia oryzisoli]MBD8065778.1 DUF924 domain-containing protein [Devosia oryzisoli]